MAGPVLACDGEAVQDGGQQLEQRVGEDVLSTGPGAPRDQRTEPTHRHCPTQPLTTLPGSPEGRERIVPSSRRFNP